MLPGNALGSGSRAGYGPPPGMTCLVEHHPRSSHRTAHVPHVCPTAAGGRHESSDANI